MKRDPSTVFCRLLWVHVGVGRGSSGTGNAVLSAGGWDLCLCRVISPPSILFRDGNKTGSAEHTFLSSAVLTEHWYLLGSALARYPQGYPVGRLSMKGRHNDTSTLHAFQVFVSESQGI